MTKDEKQLMELPEIGYKPQVEDINIETVQRTGFRLKLAEFLNFVGPGFLISIACLDPGNLAGDIAVGQETRYRLFWILVLAHVLCYIYQSLALQIGCVSKRDISTLCRFSFSNNVSKTLWVMAELALIASDTQEVLGAAVAIELLTGIPLIYGVLISICLAFAILHLQKYGQRFLESFFALFVILMAVCFWINYILMGPAILENIRGLLPFMYMRDLPVAISLIGAIIMPQNLYLHSSLVLTRKNKLQEVDKAIGFFKLETKIIVIASLIINIALVGTFSYFSDQPTLELQDASIALKHSLGSFGVFVWGVGLFSSGQSATVAGALTGQYIMEGNSQICCQMVGFLELRVSRQKRMILTRLISLVPCILVIKLADIKNSIIVLNILQFIQLPFVLIPTIKFSCSENIMGDYTLKGNKLNAILAVTGFVICLNAVQLAGQFEQSLRGAFYCIIFFMVYFGFLFFIATYEMNKVVPVRKEEYNQERELLSFGIQKVNKNVTKVQRQNSQ